MEAARGRNFVLRCSSLLLCICLGALFLGATWSAAGQEIDAHVSFKLEPTLEYIPGGTYAIWQIPPSPVAILYIAQGKTHPPNVFWDFRPVAFGSPEERLITKAALARGYAVVTVASTNSGWDLSIDLDSNVDFLLVSSFLRSWRLQHGLTDLPLAAFGCSRGGDFVTVLALGERIEGTVLMICQGVSDALEVASKDAGIWSYPPSLFIHMVRDAFTAGVVQEHKALLSSKGLSAEDIELHPFPIHQGYFAERIPLLGLNVSSRLFEALRTNGYLTSELLISLPLQLSWENFAAWNWSAMVESLEVLPRLGNGAMRWADDVAEEIGLSYAFHSCSSLHSDDMLDWLDATWKNESSSVQLYRTYSG